MESATRVLNLMAEKQIKAGERMNESMALKLHYLACFLALVKEKSMEEPAFAPLMKL